jgi:ATP-dependent RNA helicase DDX31/DBP7
MKCIVFMSCADSVDFHFELFAGQHGTAPTEDASDKTEDDLNQSVHGANTASRRKIPQGNTISESRTQGLATALSNKDNRVQVFRLHGSLQQSTRTGTLKAFVKCVEPAVLICTDVASRGLDLPNIDLVIEYDPPFSKDDHLHRIGRTARAGKDGRAMIFLIPGCEESYVDILRDCGQRSPTRHDADEVLKKGFTPTSGVVTDTDWQNAATDWQLMVERWVLGNPKYLEQARRAFQSHVRAYATHVASERKIFDMQQLHLGHLAKAFALRDKPGSMRVPGLRPGKDESRKTSDTRKLSAAKKATTTSKGTRVRDGLDVSAVSDEQEARKRMQAKMRAMGGASEFNLG